MRAFKGSRILKNHYVDRAEAHREADHYRQGFGYWRPDEDRVWRGCAVGCLSHEPVDPHKTLVRDLDVPEILFRWADALFESLPEPAFRDWTTRFIAAIPVGSDQSRTQLRLRAWLVEDEIPRLCGDAAREHVAEACRVAATRLRRLADDGDALPGEIVVETYAAQDDLVAAIAVASIDASCAASSLLNDRLYAPSEFMASFRAGGDQEAVAVRTADKLIELMAGAK